MVDRHAPKQEKVIDVEWEDSPTVVAEKIEPMFADAADMIDHGVTAVQKTVSAAKAAGVDLKDVAPEAAQALQDASARAGKTASELREAGVAVSKAKDAGKRLYAGLEKTGEVLIKIRGGRGKFARSL